MSLVMAEYVCPKHGRFDELVERNENGEAPDYVFCRHEVIASGFPAGHLPPGVHTLKGRCHLRCHWTISAPLGRVKVGEVSQGKVAKAERSTWLDTEQLADRGAWKEWKKKRTEMWHSHYQDKRKKKGLDVASFKAAKEHGK